MSYKITVVSGFWSFLEDPQAVRAESVAAVEPAPCLFMGNRLVTVFGAGGDTGLATCARLKEQGFTVRAVVRDPSKHVGRFPEGVTVVAGDVTEPASLAAACKDATGVVFTASASSYLGAGAVDRDGVSNVAAAAKDAGVQRLVLISSAFVSPGQYFSPVRLILNAVKFGLMDAKFAGEEALRASGVSYTVIRPGRLSHGPGGAALMVSQGDVGVTGNAISRADVAAVAVAALTADSAQRVTIEIFGAKPAAAAPEGQLARIFEGLTVDPPAA